MSLPTQDELPKVPGGWELRDVLLAGRSFRLFVPARLETLLGAVEGETDTVPYWGRLWPAAEPAARAVLGWAPWRVGSEILELGSGVGLVGLAALARGDRVLFSDVSEAALETCRINARRNGFSAPRARLLDWREPADLQVDVVLASDVLYDPALHEPLLETIDAALRPSGIAWIADPGRHASREFAARAAEWFDLRIRDESGDEVLLPSRTEFQIFELCRPRTDTP